MHIARQKENVAVVELDHRAGSGDRESLDALERLCADLVHAGTPCIILDMKGLRTAPSVLLATLASLQSRIQSLGGEIAVIHATNRVCKLFRVSVMDGLVGLYDEEESAAEAVTKHIQEMRRTVEDDLRSPKKFTRVEAASRLARIGDSRGTALLTGFLGDEDPLVRLQATLSLAGLGGPGVVEPLIRALSDDDYRVRMHAADALGRSADSKAIEPLKAAVRFERNRNVIFKANQALEHVLRHTRTGVTA
jgi:anti-anti-sigma regulatory factor